SPRDPINRPDFCLKWDKRCDKVVIFRIAVTLGHAFLKDTVGKLGRDSDQSTIMRSGAIEPI
ncbi:MAG: hypothetical protein JW987_10755, partial [Anaerolineaceae bacterium]|nr:hypothetical protein [Anaerolineaceae bacterium]